MAEVDCSRKDEDDSERHAYAMACRLLSRRDYSAHELRRRLTVKGVAESLSDRVIESLREQGLQSDARFTEMLVRIRLGRGYGPRRIAAELNQKGVAGDLIARHLDADPDEWRRAVKAAYRKRFKAAPQSASERAKVDRYLRQKGFSSEQIQYALRSDGQEDER